MTSYGVVSTYPPTRCGLATFTDSLVTSLLRPGLDHATIVRVDDAIPVGDPPPKAGIELGPWLRAGDPASRQAAAEALNATETVIIQHEFGIYGGPDGAEVLELLDLIHRPIIAVFHTVLASPTDHQRHIVESIADRADAIVVMTEMAVQRLQQRYRVDADRVVHIPHGAARPAEAAESRHSLRPVILTWGLIGPGKGIEWGIEALQYLQDLPLAPIYRVIGQTHPKVLQSQGEAYRESLQARAEELGVTHLLELDGRYREAPELAAEIDAADVVLLPYDSREQATSGVLSEAVAEGKPVVATRFPHAIELLSDGGGILVEQQNSEQIAAALRAVLTDPVVAKAAAARAKERGQGTSWTEVGERYRDLAHLIAPVLGVRA